MSATTKRKLVGVFEPREDSRELLGKVIEGMGYDVELHHSETKLPRRSRGSKAVDLLVINLHIFGDSYNEVTGKLEELDLAASGCPPSVMLTSLKLSQEARERLEKLGGHTVLSPSAPFMELMFAINRLLFPKIRELRTYTRVYGGFPIQFLHGGEWHQAEVYNISRQGAFIQCDKPPPENTRLEVRFVLPGRSSELEVPAHVNWVNDPGAGVDPLSPNGMGVRFLVLSQEDSQSIDRFIHARVNGNDPPGEDSPSSA